MKILDQYGTPIDTGMLREPQTARIAALQHELIESQLDGLTPAEAARILRDADQGDIVAQHRLFDDMYDRDSHLRCEFDKRAGALLTLDWRIEPPSNATAAEKRTADLVEDLLRNAVDDLEDLLLAMMEGVGHGFAPIEIEWQRWGREWLPTFHPRPQTWFRTDMARRELRLNNGSADGERLIPMGWVMHQPRKPKTGYLGRMGLYRVLVWPFIYKAYSIGDFAEFLETYGLPIILGEFMATATPEEKASLMRAVASLGHDARAIMPEGMRIEIQKVTGGGESTPHLAMVAWAEGAQSKGILGQVLSAEAKATGMGSGVADLQRDVRADIRTADARSGANTLSRDLVYPMAVLNGGGVESFRRAPRWVFDLREDAAELNTFSMGLQRLVGLGVEVPEPWVRDRVRIPAAKSDEKLLTPPVSAAGVEAALRAGASPRPAARAWRQRAATLAALALPASADTDPADQLAPRLAAEAQPAVDDWLADIERLLADNPDLTLAQIQQRLLEMFGDLPTEHLVEIMAEGYALATLVGMDDVMPNA
ncbi:DUF935 domain-containing protein [Pseudothauera rhizosphaerae]|nr:DUF935 family protein [Pseudothauera rhizosphaerae]